MAKLTKSQIKAHQRALEILTKDRLTEDEHDFVFDHWQESATHVNSASGAFFTPREMSWTFAIEVGGSRVLDLCAGIGILAYAVYHRSLWGGDGPCEITCVEINPDYAAVGKKVLPQATWIVADALSDLDIGRFDWVISNPPFGRLQGHANFDLAIVEAAERYADDGTFILPAGSVPWAYSGRPYFEADSRSEVAKRFRERTHIDLSPNCGIDCSTWEKDWRGAIPWVGPAAWNYGSYYLWGDVPALMPGVVDARKVPGFRFDGSGRSFQTASVEAHEAGTKVASSDGGRRTDKGKGARFTSRDCGVEREVAEGRKQGGDWFAEARKGGGGGTMASFGSKSPARKAASAKIAKIPLALGSHIARVYRPTDQDQAA